MGGEITRILKTATADTGLPSGDFLPLVYDELRSLADSRMKAEGAGHTLQATALVHEAWLKLSVRDEYLWKDRNHFFRVASVEMRRILVDSARRKSSAKRGSNVQHLDVQEIDIAATQPDERIILIDEALQSLETKNPGLARIVTLKFFGGLTDQEIAEVEGMSARTVARMWVCARTCLYEMMKKEM